MDKAYVDYNYDNTSKPSAKALKANNGAKSLAKQGEDMGSLLKGYGFNVKKMN